MERSEIARLKFELQEKNKLLEQEEILRKAIEKTSLLREKEFEQLKLELQKEAKLLEQEKMLRKTIEEKLSQKEKECQELKDSLESLKDVLVKKGYAKKLISPEEKDWLWIPGKSLDRRRFPRLDLNRDYTRTITLRIESQDKSISVKSFANNIGLEGLCFEAKREFKEADQINLRLFFFGAKVPIIRIKAQIIWKRTVPPVNYYGVSFISLEEEDKTNLSHYIESKMERG